MQSAALDYAGAGIRVNALVPGTTDTELVRNLSPIGGLPDDAYQVAMRQWAKSNVPGLGRLATPEEIAAFALTLAAPEHRYLTGAQPSTVGRPRTRDQRDRAVSRRTRDSFSGLRTA